MTGHYRFTDKGTLIIPCAIALVTVIVFSPTLWHDFINYDDPLFVINNPAVKTGLTWDGFVWAFTTGHQGNWIPLTWLSHMLDVQLFGFQAAAGHHAVNLLLHTASSVLLYHFLQQVTAAPWKSATVAVLFALHPLHVESVAWVAERKDVLSAFFCMLTLNAYANYTQAPSRNRYLVTVLTFASGVLAKSMLVSMPLLLLLIDYWPLGRLNRVAVRQLLCEKIPFAIIAIGAGLATYTAHRDHGAIADSFTLTARAGKAALAYLAYIGKMVWPTKLAVIYTFSLYPPRTEIVLASVIVLLIITMTVLHLRGTYPYLATGWLWYAISLFPVCGLLQIGMHSIADRYTYIPLIGIFCIVAWGVPDIARRLHLPPLTIPIIAVLTFTAMTVVTVRQVRHWQDSITLFRHTVAVTENNWVAHTGLGIALKAAGQEDEAVQHLLTAIKAKPSYVNAYLHLGYLYAKRGNVQPAIDAYLTVLRYEPDYAEARYNLGYLYLQTGKISEAHAQYRQLLELQSELAATLLQEITAQQPAGHTSGNRP